MPTKRPSSSGNSPPTPPTAPAQPSPARPPEPALTTPLRDLTFVRAAEADALERLELRTVADLIRHLPMRYERLEAEAPIANLQDGDNVSARGEITATKVAGNRYSAAGKSRFQAVLVDDSGRLDLIWFNMPYMQKRIFPGMRVRVQGTAKRFGPGLQIVNPRLEVLNPEGGNEPAARDARLRPVYPASETINSQQIERIMVAALPGALPLIPDHLPEEYRKAKEMPSLAEAYRMAHQPASEAEGHEARRRLAFDELLMLQLGVFMRRAQVRRTTVAPALPWSETIDSHIRARFPFPLTPAQDQVVQEIIKDLGKEDPANRLIQGDVGSGKTVVALYAMLMAVAAQKQAAIMAPTEILAEQHWYSITEMLKGSNVKLSLLTGAVTGREREDTLNAIKSGAIDIVVGTHALLSESVQFHDLGVVVIDEQHRFGVHQRAALRAKGRPSPDGRPFTPHILVMTATPIPRTLALTLFGDLDVSTIRGLPPGRQPILTKHVSPDTSAEVYRWVGTRIDAGEQAYVVVPAIDTGASSAGNGGDIELNDLRTVQARLEAHELAGKRIAALHGRLHSRTRENIMGRFRAGLIDCLIATTVIEVGVDVPNATVMVVEHAEQFGLAQLHQLRGRIGRGQKRSVCVLIGEAKTPDAEARLKVMVDTRDGFELAERDLEIRGPGEFFGMRQAGAPPFLIADLMHDRELLAMARRDAAAWIDRSPELRAPGEDLLRKRLMRLHGKWLGLGDVG